MGYDTPLNWYYLVITPVTEGRPTDDPVYSNLEEPGAENNSLDFYLGVCRSMGVEIPAEMVAAIEDDRANRRMNHRRNYASVA